MRNQVATFRLDRQLFGVNIHLVREINPIVEITPIPQTPNYVRGLINLRGQIVTVLDLGIRMGRPVHEITMDSHILILKTDPELANSRRMFPLEDLRTSDDVIGLLVDCLGDVVEFEEAQIESTPANVVEMEGRFFSGVVRLDRDLLVLLDLVEILKKDAMSYKYDNKNDRVDHCA